jgi:pimeloyl-ACP methyl ester carboxylesterase
LREQSGFLFYESKSSLYYGMREYFFGQRGIAYRANDLLSGRKTLLFLHGISSSASAWLHYERHFESRCNVISLDLRGHGKSLRPRHYADYALEKSAEDIAELIQYLDVDDIVLISHSLGTIVAQKLLLTNPAGISKSVLIAPVFKLDNSVWYSAVKMLFSYALYLATLIQYRTPSGRVDYSRYVNVGDWNLFRIAADIRNTGFRAYLFSFLQIHEKLHDSDWKRVNTATVIIHGTEDTVIPCMYARLLLKELPHATLEEIVGVNHVLVTTAAEKLTTVLDRVV